MRVGHTLSVVPKFIFSSLEAVQMFKVEPIRSFAEQYVPFINLIQDNLWSFFKTFISARTYEDEDGMIRVSRHAWILQYFVVEIRYDE